MDFTKYENKLSFKADKYAYRIESNRLYKLFMSDMAEDLGYSDHVKRPILERMAWDRGHSSGYSEVYNHASELAELLS
jgi:hypothetical protein